MADRMADHLIYHSTNDHLQYAIPYYGIDKFEFFVVLFSASTIANEQPYLDYLFSLPQNMRYNISRVATASFSGLNHTFETRERISRSLKGIFSGVNNPCFGRTGEKHPMFSKTGPNLGITPVNATVVYVYLAYNNTLVLQFDSQVAAASNFKVIYY